MAQWGVPRPSMLLRFCSSLRKQRYHSVSSPKCLYIMQNSPSNAKGTRTATSCINAIVNPPATNLCSSPTPRTTGRRYLTLPPAVFRRLLAMEERHNEIIESFDGRSSSGTGVNPAYFGKELSRLKHVSSLRRKLSSLEDELEVLRELLREAEEAVDEIDDVKRDCLEELQRVEREVRELEALVVEAVLPRDDEDTDADAVLEIRAGTGGDEASLFASELLACYEKTAKHHGWSWEILKLSQSDLGGVKEAAFSIMAPSSGGYLPGRASCDDSQNGEDLFGAPLQGPYGFFKWESGVHRVQRVPVNDVRIHTSTASVAVLPAASPTGKSSKLSPSDLKIETFRASGAGGQHVNTTESAVRITHLPTGVTAAIQDERSQHKNKAKAMRLIEARVADRERQERSRQIGEARRSLMGGGTRSERIRTYNIPQDRVTDHRASLSAHGIEGIMRSGGEDGLVATFAPALMRMWREEMLLELELEAGGEDAEMYSTS